MDEINSIVNYIPTRSFHHLDRSKTYVVLSVDGKGNKGLQLVCNDLDDVMNDGSEFKDDGVDGTFKLNIDPPFGKHLTTFRGLLEDNNYRLVFRLTGMTGGGYTTFMPVYRFSRIEK